MACNPESSAEKKMFDHTGLRQAGGGYMPIEHYGLIGNMHTAAMVATDGSIDMMCWPHFDSPSVFCRMLDKDKGGFFSISLISDSKITTKQQYLPSSNLLQTMYLTENGVMKLVDFFPVNEIKLPNTGDCLVRRLECVRGEINVAVKVLPAFNYARDQHTVECHSHSGDWNPETAIFRSREQAFKLQAVLDKGSDRLVCFLQQDHDRKLGHAITSSFSMKEGEHVTFVFRDCGSEDVPEPISTRLLDSLQQETKRFWFDWISQSKYHGRWREVVHRSLLTLKMLTFEPTGAIVAAPTFSLPESIGGPRNWDYRFSWVRDSSFTIYILLRMGFKAEAEAYMAFIEKRMKHSRTEDGALPIMFSIHGSTDLPEIELSHLEGYRGSRPVRIGNGAAFHKQLDIYGELMDAIHLYNKYGKPISYDSWLCVRELTDYVCRIWHEKDMSIWEVRGEVQQFVYSKIMLWVAIDRALRLADKRSFPCPSRLKWLSVRDEIMESVMVHGYNKEMACFIQSYEHPDVLDSAVLIAPLVFFVAPNDPRFTSTLDQILLPPEKGGLTSNGMVYRYNNLKSDDGVGGSEGAFSMCTFWLIEALTRAGAYEPIYLEMAVNMFENTLGFANHLSMFSEEINKSGEQLGNTPQAFSHLALISAAFNLDRVTSGKQGV